MPLYEYECAQCHRRLEKIQKFSDPELTVCPHCGGALARTITAPAFHFAGGGWYKDGYASAPAAAAEAGGSGDSKAPAATGAAPAAATSTPAPATATAPSAPPAPSTAPAASKP